MLSAIKNAFAFSILSAMLGMTIGCSKLGFQAAASKETIVSQSVFGEDNGDASGSINQNSGNNASGSISQNGAETGGVSSPIDALICNTLSSVGGSNCGVLPNGSCIFDNQLTAATGTTNSNVTLNYQCTTSTSSTHFVDIKSFRIEVDSRSVKKNNPSTCSILNYTTTETPLCSFADPALRDEILNTKKLNLQRISAEIKQNCPVLADGGGYELKLLDSATSKVMNTLQVESRGGLLTTDLTSLNIIFDYNPEMPGPAREMPEVACDSLSSPLVIHMDSGDDDGPLKLTSQRRGISFDILGDNADPIPHTLKRISWHRSLKYLFIALPDADGRVNGIDELFGNNTRGPDGMFAFSGYEALAKYDGTSVDGSIRLQAPDGFIDASDAIFKKLRLWQDENFDGVAQTGELHPLSDFGVVRIDLRYNSAFREVDRFGNETRYKSVVETADGKAHLLFDIWFRYY
jgi:hypothetical protein